MRYQYVQIGGGTERESNERDNLIEVAFMGLHRKLALGKFPGIYSITLAKNP